MQIIRLLVVCSVFGLLPGCGSNRHHGATAIPPVIEGLVVGHSDACVVVVGDLGNLNLLTIEADGTNNSGFLTVPIGNDWEHDLVKGIDNIGTVSGSIVAGCTEDAEMSFLAKQARHDIQQLAGSVRLWLLYNNAWREEPNLVFASPPPTSANLGTLMDFAP